MAGGYYPAVGDSPVRWLEAPAVTTQAQPAHLHPLYQHHDVHSVLGGENTVFRQQQACHFEPQYQAEPYQLPNYYSSVYQPNDFNYQQLAYYQQYQAYGQAAWWWQYWVSQQQAAYYQQLTQLQHLYQLPNDYYPEVQRSEFQALDDQESCSGLQLMTDEEEADLEKGNILDNMWEFLEHLLSENGGSKFTVHESAKDNFAPLMIDVDHGQKKYVLVESGKKIGFKEYALWNTMDEEMLVVQLDDGSYELALMHRVLNRQMELLGQDVYDMCVVCESLDL
jgi:hypothetical protein